MSRPFFRCESFPYISRRADWFPVPCFPFIPPALPLFSCLSLSCPFSSPFISRCFPAMSTSYFLPSFPCTSLYFPFAPQHFPQKTRFSSVFAKMTSKNIQTFGKRRQEPTPAKSQGDSSLGPFATPVPRRLRLVERHQISARGAPPPQNPTYLTSGGGGKGYPLSSDAPPHCRRTFQY